MRQARQAAPSLIARGQMPVSVRVQDGRLYVALDVADVTFGAIVDPQDPGRTIRDALSMLLTAGQEYVRLQTSRPHETVTLAEVVKSLSLPKISAGPVSSHKKAV